uniref:Putative secreted protein n=1 Tax=Ixodes ricinus TaxID=34613 RepID=A0A6B0UD84_IXORI
MRKLANFVLCLVYSFHRACSRHRCICPGSSSCGETGCSPGGAAVHRIASTCPDSCLEAGPHQSRACRTTATRPLAPRLRGPCLPFRGSKGREHSSCQHAAYLEH